MKSLMNNLTTLSYFLLKDLKDDLHVRVVRMAATDEGALGSVQLGSLARSLLTQRPCSQGFPTLNKIFLTV
jgi:hypothetical protein